jgi:hypothetical protein
MEMFRRLLRQAAAVDGDVIFDEAAKPVDPLDGVEEELVAGACDEHLMEFVVGLEDIGTRPGLETTVAQGGLDLAGALQALDVRLERRQQHRLLLDHGPECISILVTLSGRQSLAERPPIPRQSLDPAFVSDAVQNFQETGSGNVVEAHQLVFADTLLKLARQTVFGHTEVDRLVAGRVHIVVGGFERDIFSVDGKEVAPVWLGPDDTISFEFLESAQDRRTRNPERISQQLQWQVLALLHAVRLHILDDVAADLWYQAFPSHPPPCPVHRMFAMSSYGTSRHVTIARWVAGHQSILVLLET